MKKERRICATTGCNNPVVMWNGIARSKRCPSCNLRVATNVGQQKKDSKGFRGGKPSKKKSPETLMMEKADKYFSLYIRISKRSRVIDGAVYCKDIINGREFNAKGLDNGHFISRGNHATRYDVRNCWPQNRSANRFQGESCKPSFEKNMRKTLGDDEFESLMHDAKGFGQNNIRYHEEIAEKYKKLVNDLAEELDIKKWW